MTRNEEGSGSLCISLLRLPKIQTRASSLPRFTSAIGDTKPSMAKNFHGFCERLPQSEGKNTSLVGWIGKNTKFGYFLSLAHPFTASDVARMLLDSVVKIHGLPLFITLDRDKIFTSNFWRELFKQLGVGLHMSTACHPEIDGQTERVNQCLEAYLRCVCFTKPKSWNQWLPLAQWCYNSNFHSSLMRSPFEALFGYKPPLIPAVMHYSNVERDVDRYLRQRQKALQLIKQELTVAQN